MQAEKNWKTGRARALGTAVLPLILVLGACSPAAETAPESKADSPTAGKGAGNEGNPAQPPALDARVKNIIDVDGQSFKDLNDNGQLDSYEDWRLPVEDRAADLVTQMTLEEKSGLMLIDTLNAACDPETNVRGTLDPVATDYIDTQRMHRFVFRNVVTSADKATCGKAGESFAASTSLTPEEAAQYTNSVQELGEATRLGIPMLFKSNARNHIDPDARAGINEAAGAFTAFPKEAGIAAAALGEEAAQTGGDPTAGDMSVVEDFAGVMGREWESIGLRGMYGYMADLSTEPRWYRAHETFTEDADLNASIMESLVETLQGPVEDGVSLSPETSVALTLKHFPGGGPQELGLDAHYSFGKTQVYPGDGFGYHLKPFEAAIDAGVSSIMPYYGAPVGVTHEGVTYDQTGMAFSGQVVNDLLRDQLGFSGYVNSDTGIINDRAWGLEDKSVPERVAAAINGGTDTLSGFHDVTVITDLVTAGLVSEERVTLAAERLVEPLFRMGLFENPYVDPAAATATIGSEDNREVGLDLQRKSAVLLQNEETAAGGNALPLKDGSDVYILGDINEDIVKGYGYKVTNGNTADPANRPSAADTDHVVISVTAKNTNTDSYQSNDPETGLNPDHINPVTLDGVAGLDGTSVYGAADACVTEGAEDCTDDGLRYGGSLPWESSVLDFTGMAESKSWEITPSLETIQDVMSEVGDPGKVILHVYFRQPYVLDEASGLRDAGGIIAGFGMGDAALFDLLSGKISPQGKMPFALAGTSLAVREQFSDLPGYKETADGELFPFGFGLTY
ncbi:glycoside hydrolase family 3 N-terminal domain-containing protein [Arthrobacter sp. APC 3897]|uniref:glycoside hydrolase family 3 protein n=1 Tax=Arthrobacter sp. APC 3897 TaxID=3035204 RepID=UPI0025B4B2D5|nr:glycoside hydrolase family 3 N-terminal domain-containing protein [Arthrobacter sp. APC 3897]MDN3481834.1 glycoside hydrolase family 3 N-terminal domain-containing protein [Arthrobacter sp. APC 3897]